MRMRLRKHALLEIECLPAACLEGPYRQCCQMKLSMQCIMMMLAIYCVGRHSRTVR
jgi:hypothetical protein